METDGGTVYFPQKKLKEIEMQKYVDKDFMRNLALFIQRSGKTKTQVAKDLSISRQILSEYLSGKTFPKAERLDEIARYFGVSKVDFFKVS